MKRYLIIGGYREVAMLDDLTKQHLVDLKNGIYDAIIDTKNGNYFDPKTNTWVEIKEF